jgi:hypothetical protein
MTIVLRADMVKFPLADLPRGAVYTVDSHEEAVHAMAMRHELQPRPLGRHVTGGDRRPYLADRQGAEARITREEGVDPILVLARQQRAGRVDEPPAGFDQRCRLVEQPVLQHPQLA